MGKLRLLVGCLMSTTKEMDSKENNQELFRINSKNWIYTEKLKITIKILAALMLLM